MNNIENIYSLSPSQQGLLFHSVYEPDSRVYYQQLSLSITGALDTAAFTSAWKDLIQRHSVLRTAFLWEELDDAYQVVQRELPLPLTEHDWRGREDLDTALGELESQQRKLPFDFGLPPLLRLCLVRLTEQRWQLIWTFHHILMDGWSVGVAMQEWLALYQAYHRGEMPTLPTPSGYQDFIAWLAERDADAADTFWRQQLQDLTEATPLPNFARRSSESFDLPHFDLPHFDLPYAEREIHLSDAETDALNAFCRAQRLTLNTLIQGAWALLLGFHAGRDQVVYGVTVSGRPDDLPASDSMVGLFINTLPLLVQWSDNPSIGDWLRALQEHNSDVRQYAYIPLAKLKPLSGMAAEQPLFDSILVFENFPVADALNQGASELTFATREEALTQDGLRLTRGRNHFPLSLIAMPEERLEFVLSYERRRFSDTEISFLCAQLKALLAAMIQHPEATVLSLDWTPEAEQRTLLAWGSGPDLPVPSVCLQQLFEQYAAASPAQTALVSRREALTYKQLNKRANRLGRHLLNQGIGPGALVALALERSADFVVAVLATLKTGAAYLPLDLKQPAARLTQIIADSAATALIQQSKSTAVIAAPAVPALWLDSAAEQIAEQSYTALDVAVAPNSAAYVIYTSGSTGEPKGVVVEHRAIVDYLHSIGSVLALPTPSRYALLSTVAADLGHTQLFGALCTGSTLVLVDEDTSFNPPALADFLAAQQVDMLKITPGHLRGLLAAHPTADLLPSHTLVFGGEALDNTLVNQVRELAPALRIFNHYGPTEATVGAVATHLPAAPEAEVVPMGKPLPNRRLYVLDTQGRLAPVGVPGELYIGGALAREYLNRPQLTQQRFVSLPVAGAVHRLYRSGDRVRWLSDGNLAFLDRVDNQVKIRGNRIELGEVQAQIQQLSPHIQQVVVRLIQPDDQSQQLVAYIVAAQSLSADKLRSDLNIHVPDYMVPAHFITLDAIPLTANGKPDYHKLPPPQQQTCNRPTYIAPRNHTERVLTDIWQSVLKREPIGIHDNFFSLGGDSILNLQIIARANQQGLRLTPKHLFENRTIAAIAAVAASGVGSDSETSEVQAPEGDQPIPFGAGQRARLEAGPLEASWRCVALEQNTNTEDLRRALTAVQQHHQALRLALEKTPEGHWQQKILAQPKLPPICEYTVSANDRGAFATKAHSLGQSLAHSLAQQYLQQLDPAAGEILHACLLDHNLNHNLNHNINQGEHRSVLLTAHPLCLDEASWPHLLQDLTLALAQIRYGRPVQLTPHGGDFSRWLQHQQRYSESDAIETAWEHWLQYAEQSLPPLPTVANNPSSTTTLHLDSDTSTRLQRLRDRSHLSWTSLLATVLAQLIHTHTKHSLVLLDIQCGRPEACRLSACAPIASADIDPSRLVGPLDHNTPVFFQWPASDDPLERLHHIDRQLNEQPQLGADYGVLRYLSTNTYLQEPLLTLPRAQIALNLLGDWDSHREEHGALGAITAASPPPAAGYALAVAAYWRQGQLCLQCQGPLAAAWGPILVDELETLALLAEEEKLRPTDHTFPLCSTQVAPLLEQGVKQRVAQRAEQEVERPFDWEHIADIYPLSPMQQGMLLHTLLQPHSGVYLMQQRYRWEGPLDRRALESAWQLLLQRHPMLRTGFWWQDESEPLQCVYRHTEPACDWYDWRHLDNKAQARQLDQVLAAERYRGFDMRLAPLTYLRVFQLGEHDFSIVRSFHHILTDAWCFGLLMQDLLAIYQARVKQEPVARPHPRPFRDYISWLARRDMDAAQTFWTTELAGFTEPTSLAIDKPATLPEQAPEEVGDVDFTFSIAQTQCLQKLCQEHQLTPNTWIQGAWALLLSRYNGCRDVLFGTTVAGRPTDLAGVEAIVGLFINSLPLRVQIDPDQDTISWLQALLTHNVELREFEYAPLVDIQRWSDVESGRTLFDSLVVFENAPLNVSSEQQHEFSVDIYEDRVHTNFPLTVVLYPDDHLRIRLAYDKRRFAHDGIERMLAHLAQLLGNMLDNPRAPLQTLEMLSQRERHQLLTEWNQTQADFPLHQTYATLFAQRVAAHPSHTVAVCNNEQFTYAELDVRANRIACALRQAGAGPDTLVALAAPRGLPLLTMMIAVLKAGAAFQPLDIQHPPQRLGELLNLSEAPIVLLSHSAAALLDQILPQINSQPTCLTAEALWLTADNPQLPCIGTVDHLAYIIFTSGSTGAPKGAMVEQRGMLNNIFGKVPALSLGEADHIAQTASPAFDISIWQFLAAPLLGGCVHILPDNVAHDPIRLLNAIESEKLTVLEAVPPLIRGLLQECQPHHNLTSLRWLLPTGEALPPALCRDWLSRFPGVPMMNAYGPAECSDDVAFYPIIDAPAETCPHMPIGRPTANNQLFILDTSLRPVPIGVAGEICASGTGVGRGYFKDPERTQLSFVPHPFAAGQRFYRTGDIGRYGADGVIDYIGRRDQQVKVRGHRIELGEIENRIVCYPIIESAAVVAVADRVGTLQLVAYYVLKAGANDDRVAVATHLKQQLPDYMVPAHWMRLDQLPLNSNGKVDHRQLAARPLQAATSEILSRTAPRSATERTLANIWQSILSLDELGVENNFFYLGGHSLQATQVMSRIRRVFDLQLPLRALFEYPTIDALAKYIDSALSEQRENSTLPPITRQPRDDNIPLSFAQQRLWFLEQLQPGSNLFTLPFTTTLFGELNLPALQQSLIFLIERHEVLRTAIIADCGEPRQHIEAVRDLPQHPSLAVEDLSHLKSAEQDVALQRQLRQLLQTPFDLQQPPLLRAAVFCCKPEHHILALAVHHIAVDDWSLGLLVEDLSVAYADFSQERSPQLPPLAVQYADFAIWQRRYLSGNVWQQQLRYWRNQLAGCITRLDLPGKRTQPVNHSRREDCLRPPLPVRLTQTLQQLAERNGCTLFMLLYAALNVLLSQQSNRTDLLVGTDVANRQHRETENIVGFFINQLVLRCRLHPEQPFIDLLANCRAISLDAYEHQDLPFDNLVAELLPQRDAGITPFFQIKLILQNAPQRDLNLGALRIEESSTFNNKESSTVRDKESSAEFDLLINCMQTPEGLEVLYRYNANRYQRPYIEQLTQLFETLLTLVASADHITVAALAAKLDQRQLALQQQALERANENREQQRAALTKARRKTVTNKVTNKS